MYNLKKMKQAQVVTEKYIRKENIGPKADDDQPITEKVLADTREGDNTKTVEAYLDEDREKIDIQVIEKVLNATKGLYMDHRSAKDGLSVPPINTLVANLEKDRREDLKVEKKEHWSQHEPNQKGALPKWPKVPKQHDKTVLNNDPDRFGKDVKPLVGGITTADIDTVVARLKTGEAADYDTAILAILKEADREKRELTSVERRTVVDLKIARTKAMMQK